MSAQHLEIVIELKSPYKSCYYANESISKIFIYILCIMSYENICHTSNHLFLIFSKTNTTLIEIEIF